MSIDAIASMTDTIKWDLLDRYFRGQCSPEEVEAIERWVEHSDSGRALLLSFRRVWELTGAIPEQFDAQAGWRAIRAKLPHRARVVVPMHWQRTQQVRKAPQLVWRAAVGILVCTAVFGLWRWGPGARSIVARATGRASAAPRDFVTARGQRGMVMLTDGTQAWLNAASRLRIGTEYGVRGRDVYLDGEATFTVQHDTTKPFRVHTANAIAEDVGTEFVVRAYSEDSATTVVVVTGAVNLLPRTRPAGGGVMLTRGQLGEVDRRAFVTVKDDVDVDAYRGWQEGRLQFDDVPLAGVARELERWYGVRITLGDSTLGQIPVKATFVNQSVDDVAGIIARSIGGRYVRDGQTIRLFVPITRSFERVRQ
jgi:transmembrane sensor